jgi:hypothetical protein
MKGGEFCCGRVSWDQRADGDHSERVSDRHCSD